MTDDEVAVDADDLAETETILRTTANVAQAIGDDKLATRAATLAERFGVKRMEAVNLDEEVGEA